MSKGGEAFNGKAASIILREEAERAKQLIIQHIIANGQNASGRTVKSLNVEQPSEEEMILWGHKPFGVLETGRKSGKIPYRFRDIILQWMQDKGVHGQPMPYKTDRPHKYTPEQRGDMSMAGAIARSIATKGSKLHRDGGRADVYSNVILDTMERIRSRLTTLVQLSFSSIKLNNETI